MKIICVGRNYVDHIKELNNATPGDPVIFMKPETAIPIKNMPFFYPDFSQDVQHEVEIVLRIDKVGKNIEEQFAYKYYSEIRIGIDFTARDLQAQLKSKGLPWELDKAFDGSAPVSEKFIPKNNFPDLKNINFSLKVNNIEKQNGNTSLMLFSFDYIISFVSKYITLKKGDLIFTGTPAGVSAVQVGDTLEAFIENESLLQIKIK